jgi:hypothetical protein
MSVKETDNELLKLAVKAIGVNMAQGSSVEINGKVWNPLVNDGDAFRLAVRLRLTVTNGKGAVCVSFPGYSVVDDTSKDPEAVTRRAIVRAAAEIGRSLGR